MQPKKIIIEALNEDSWEPVKECADLKTATTDKKVGERIHVCYHDGNNQVPSCKIIE